MLEKIMIVLRNSSIKGYYVFQIKPHPEIKMLVQNEDDNKSNPFPLLIRMSELINSPIKLHNDITREAKRGKIAETVKSITNKVVGRIPTNLGKFFRDLQNQWCIKITWQVYASSSIPPTLFCST